MHHIAVFHEHCWLAILPDDLRLELVRLTALTTSGYNLKDLLLAIEELCTSRKDLCESEHSEATPCASNFWRNLYVDVSGKTEKEGSSWRYALEIWCQVVVQAMDLNYDSIESRLETVSTFVREGVRVGLWFGPKRLSSDTTTPLYWDGALRRAGNIDDPELVTLVQSWNSARYNASTSGSEFVDVVPLKQNGMILIDSQSSKEGMQYGGLVTSIDFDDLKGKRQFIVTTNPNFLEAGFIVKTKPNFLEAGPIKEYTYYGDHTVDPEMFDEVVDGWRSYIGTEFDPAISEKVWHFYVIGRDID
jgi:hypothetical protein